jgi:hypothetical protein
MFCGMRISGFSITRFPIKGSAICAGCKRTRTTPPDKKVGPFRTRLLRPSRTAVGAFFEGTLSRDKGPPRNRTSERRSGCQGERDPTPTSANTAPPPRPRRASRFLDEIVLVARGAQAHPGESGNHRPRHPRLTIPAGSNNPHGTVPSGRFHADDGDRGMRSDSGQSGFERMGGRFRSQCKLLSKIFRRAGMWWYVKYVISYLV